jgi:thiamine biosynthesis lipoprotein
MKKIAIIAAAFVLVILMAVVFTSSQTNIFSDSRIAMDTVVTINVVSSSKSEANKAFQKAFEEMEKLGLLINFYSDKSEISMVNKNAGIKAVHASPETLDLVKQAIHVAELTNGDFDPSIGAITALWDFHKKIRPEDRDIRSKLQLVSYRDIKIDENRETIFLKKKGMMIDLGGIAKGYAADKVVAILTAGGIKAALVSVAGDIRAYGVKPDGTPWKIGIQDPRPLKPSFDILAALPLRDKAISTSGDYQRFFEIDGVRYHHIMDPRTGMPARGCESVTVIADKGVLTDSLATAVFVAGPQKGFELLKKLGYGGVIVDSDGKLRITPGLEKEIEIKRIKS